MQIRSPKCLRYSMIAAQTGFALSDSQILGLDYQVNNGDRIRTKKEDFAKKVLHPFRGGLKSIKCYDRRLLISRIGSVLDLLLRDVEGGDKG